MKGMTMCWLKDLETRKQSKLNITRSNLAFSDSHVAPPSLVQDQTAKM